MPVHTPSYLFVEVIRRTKDYARFLTTMGHRPTDASVLSASRVLRLRLFPSHHRPGSQVPCESPNESHASYTPDTAWPVGRFPPYFSQGGETPVLMSVLKRFRCF